MSGKTITDKLGVRWVDYPVYTPIKGRAPSYRIKEYRKQFQKLIDGKWVSILLDPKD